MKTHPLLCLLSLALIAPHSTLHAQAAAPTLSIKDKSSAITYNYGKSISLPGFNVVDTSISGWPSAQPKVLANKADGKTADVKSEYIFKDEEINAYPRTNHIRKATLSGEIVTITDTWQGKPHRGVVVMNSISFPHPLEGSVKFKLLKPDEKKAPAEADTKDWMDKEYPSLRGVCRGIEVTGRPEGNFKIELPKKALIEARYINPKNKPEPSSMGVVNIRIHFDEEYQFLEKEGTNTYSFSMLDGVEKK